MTIFHPKHCYLNWRAIPWIKGLRSFDFFQKFGIFVYSLELKVFSIYSRIRNFSFLHVLLELWFSWFFRFLDFVWTHLNISSAWQNNQFSFYFILVFFFSFFIFLQLIHFDQSTQTLESAPDLVCHFKYRCMWQWESYQKGSILVQGNSCCFYQRKRVMAQLVLFSIKG